MRRWRYGFISIFVFVITAGIIMISLHGFAFFVFRSAGAGQTPANGTSEDQGPGQPDAFTLKATMPDGRVITLNSPVDDTWAGVARLPDGEWAVLAAGTARGQVTTVTASSWRMHESLYRSEWTVVSVREGAG